MAEPEDHPGVDVAGMPTPSPTANAASLTSWATIRPSTRPGASPTRSVTMPSVAKNRSAAATVAGAVVGPTVTSASVPSGGSRWKPADGPPGSSAARGAVSQSSS
jgi:hypothetical protein